MARWEAQRWRCHPYQGRELVAYWSDTDEGRANDAAIRYLEALQAEGYELEMLNDGVHAAKGDETFVVKVEQKAI